VSVPISKIFNGPVSATGFGEAITSKALMFPAQLRAANPKIPATVATINMTPEAIATNNLKRLVGNWTFGLFVISPLRE
jgi:hypothetical protein